ncbi:MAG: hypothetical protein IKA12_03670 [Clostridia bacterium]|nr:hypothetical protein [Clostridia bacterium]
MGIIKNFKKTLCVIFAILVLTVSSTVFLGCNNNSNPPHKGIPLENQNVAPYSNQTKTYATETIKQLLIDIYKASINSNVSANTLNLLSAHANEISKITENQGLTEKAYTSVFENIENNSQNYASAFSSVQSGTTSAQDITNLRKFLGLLSSSFSIDATATIIYNFSDYYYGYLYEKNLKEYQDYGWKYKLDDAEKALADRKTLTEEITLSNFIPTIKLAYFLGELVLGGAESTSAIKNLTTSEIALMLKTPDFSSINMSVKGWKLVLSMITKFSISDVYLSQLIEKFSANGDLNLVANKMNDFISLFNKTQKKFSENHANYLRQGEKDLFIREIFVNFTNDDWSSFESLTALNFDTAYYNGFATEYYGVKYTNYYATIIKTDVTTLKNSVDGDDFIKTLKNYFAGIFPALFYGVEL